MIDKMADHSSSTTDEDQGPPLRVLVVDNEKAHASVMLETLERVGYTCAMATSGPEGAKVLESGQFDIVVTDLMMNDIDGMGILSRAKEVNPETQVIMVTGHATVPRAVEAMQGHAYSFLEKPITPAHLRAVVEKAASEVRLKQGYRNLQQRLDEKFGFEKIIHQSPQMKAVIDRLKRIAPTDAVVLITGESGTGKELIAQAIHQNSPRKNKPFVALNTGAVAEHLVESELFGHVKGAFTDALQDRQGKFEYANGGTLFLDEVGDMPMSTQIKLLRVLEEREITRVGDNKTSKVNVRVISATNRSLEEAVANGDFRNDLYFRLKVVTVELPALRERIEDIVPLAEHFRKQFAKHHQKEVSRITPAAVQKLRGYDWPGNVRQLRNTIETMVVLDADGNLDVDDLPPELSEVEIATTTASGGPSDLIGQPLADIERWAIEETLALTNGNREEAARVLGIGARTLYRRLDQYNKE